MAEYPTQDRLHALQQRMSETWDVRMRHEYRFWMSDGVESDEVMWQSGARDFAILFPDTVAEQSSNGLGLEIGCGVGRLLRPAANYFGQVIGVDVSATALEEARRLLFDYDNLRFICGTGTEIPDVANNSVDAVFAFACFAHMPACVAVANFIEVHRILKDEGSFIVQLYLGRVQPTVEDDTIAIRCYDKDAFIAATHEAGFRCEAVEELILPFDAADRINEVIPYLCRMRKRLGGSTANAATILANLLPSGEEVAPDAWAGSRFEYLLAITRVTQLINSGRLSEAREMLEFAIENYKDAEPGAFAVLAELKKE